MWRCCITFHLKRYDIPVVFRLKGPPPPLEGPLAVNTRLQKGRRLFPGQLRGPESFTADEEGERAPLSSDLGSRHTLASLACALFICAFQVTCTRAQSTGSCGGSAPMTVWPSSRRWDRAYRNAVGVVLVYVRMFTCFLNSACVLRQQHRFWARVWSSARRSPGPPWSADRRGLVLRAAQRRPSNWSEDGSGVQLSGWRVWGILSFHPSVGHFTPGLSSGADGVPFAFLNGLEVSSQTGMIYFTDSSSRWGRRHVKLEVTCLFLFQTAVLHIYSGNRWWELKDQRVDQSKPALFSRWLSLTTLDVFSPTIPTQEVWRFCWTASTCPTALSCRRTSASCCWRRPVSDVSSGTNTPSHNRGFLGRQLTCSDLFVSGSGWRAQRWEPARPYWITWSVTLTTSASATTERFSLA